MKLVIFWPLVPASKWAIPAPPVCILNQVCILNRNTREKNLNDETFISDVDEHERARAIKLCLTPWYVSDPSLKIDESGRELPLGTIGARKELKCYVPVTRLTQSTAQLAKLF